MQTDPDAIRKGGVDDDKKITFRPSPNFCNMKRFLKKKIVDTCSMDEPPTQITIKQDLTPTTSYNPQNVQPQVEKKDVKPKIQPPLPLYPPPPDSPDLVKVKQEAEEYTAEPEDEASINVSQLTTTQTANTPAEKPKKAICKDYIRGTCLRTQCKFAHERDLSQLEGIYTFCWDYQNSNCMIPNCKYVHASPFEEGEFYRTGVLPAHALNHVKQAQASQTSTSSAQPPPGPGPAAPGPVPAPNMSILPPPPPPPPEEPPQMDMSVLFQNPPPPLYTPMPVEKQQPVMMMVPPPPVVPPVAPPVVPEVDNRAVEAFRMQHVMLSTSKRDWRGIPEVANPLLNELEQASCSSCTDMEFRLQYNKSKVEKQILINKELENKSAQLDKKISKLYSVLVTLLKPQSQQPKTSTVTSLSTNGKEKVCIW